MLPKACEDFSSKMSETPVKSVLWLTVWRSHLKSVPRAATLRISLGDHLWDLPK